MEMWYPGEWRDKFDQCPECKVSFLKGTPADQVSHFPHKPRIKVYQGHLRQWYWHCSICQDPTPGPWVVGGKTWKPGASADAGRLHLWRVHGIATKPRSVRYAE